MKRAGELDKNERNIEYVVFVIESPGLFQQTSFYTCCRVKYRQMERSFHDQPNAGWRLPSTKTLVFKLKVIKSETVVLIVVVASERQVRLLLKLQKVRVKKKRGLLGLTLCRIMKP